MPEPGEDRGEDPKKPQNGTGSAEPVETDPCMGQGDLKPAPRPPLVDRYASWVRARTGLDRKGAFVASAVVILTLVLLIVVVALAVAWPRLPHKFLFPVCKDAACLRAAAQISESLNTSVPLCENLWTHVCGGWLSKNPIPSDKSLWNPKEQLFQREIENVVSLVTTLPPLLWTSAEWKLKYLYDACMDVDFVNLTGPVPLLNIINQLGGCYVLGGFSSENFDRDQILMRLHNLFGVSPFFEITVEPNPHSPGLNSIRISPPKLGLPDREYYYADNDDRIQQAYKEFITDTMMLLEAPRMSASKFSNDMFSYEKRIAEVIPDRDTLLNPITSYNPLSLLELKQETNVIKFHDILQAMFVDANISESTEVIITSLEYLSRISSIIASTDTITLNGYFTWTLIRNYMPYMSKQYTDLLDTFNAELYGVQTPPPRWEICSKLINHHMGIATGVLLENKHPISTKTIDVVNETFTSILNVVRNKIQKIRGSSLLRTHLKQKLSNLNLQVGIPEELKSNNTFLREYYVKLRIIKSNLFDSVKNAKLFKIKSDERKLMQADKGYFPVDSALAKKVVYVPSHHMVVVPRSLVSEGVFESGYPKPVIYGRLGVEIAEAILSAVLPYESLWTANRNILSPFHMTVNESLRSIETERRCLRNYIMNLNLDIPLVTANQTALNILKHLSAVTIANEALMTTFDEENHIHQPGFEEYDDSPLYYLTYAQTQCSEGTSQQYLYDQYVHFELPKRSLLHIAWAQLPEFSKSFDCRQNKRDQCPGLF